jgi:hypothetical protein
MRGHHHGINVNGDEEHHLQLTELVAALAATGRCAYWPNPGLSARLQGTVTNAPSALTQPRPGTRHTRLASRGERPGHGRIAQPPGHTGRDRTSAQPCPWPPGRAASQRATLAKPAAVEAERPTAPARPRHLLGRAAPHPVVGPGPGRPGGWAAPSGPCATLANATPGTWDQQRLPVQPGVAARQHRAGQLTHFKPAQATTRWTQLAGRTWQGKLQAGACWPTSTPAAPCPAQRQPANTATGGRGQTPEHPSTPTPRPPPSPPWKPWLLPGQNSNSKQFITIKRQATFS